MTNMWRHKHFYQCGDVGTNQEDSFVVSRASHRDNENVRKKSKIENGQEQIIDRYCVKLGHISMFNLIANMIDD